MVVLGGGAGALARYVIATAIMAKTGGRFPFGTVFINLTGSFLIGLLMTVLTERFSPYPNLRLLLVTGFLGGYTTFSSFEWESLSLVTGGSWLLGLANLVGSVVVGYSAVWLGVVLGKKG